MEKTEHRIKKSRFVLQLIFGVIAVAGVLLFFYGNAVLLKMGIAVHGLGQFVEGYRWLWLTVGLALFGLIFYRRPVGKAGWIIPLDAAIIGVVAVVGTGFLIPTQQLPAPTSPQVVTAESINLKPEDWVLGVAVGEVAKAYPWDMIQKEFVVNDIINGEPIVVMYCISCNSSLAFLSKHNDQALRFGVAGEYSYETILHDDATGSWWREDGTVIAGELQGVQLEQLPAGLMEWSFWQELYPETQIAINK